MSRSQLRTSGNLVPNPGMSVCTLAPEGYVHNHPLFEKHEIPGWGNVSPQTCPSQKCLTALKKWSIGGGGGGGGGAPDGGVPGGDPESGCVHTCTLGKQGPGTCAHTGCQNPGSAQTGILGSQVLPNPEFDRFLDGPYTHKDPRGIAKETPNMLKCEHMVSNCQFDHQKVSNVLKCEI